MTEVKINLKALRRQVEETDPENPSKEAQLVLPTLRKKCELLSKRVTTICAEFRSEYQRRFLKETKPDPFTIKAEHYWAFVAYIAAAVGMVLDILVSAALSKEWLNLPPANAILAGATIGLILSFTCKAGVGVLAQAHNTQVQRSARRRLEIINVAAFALNVFLIVVVLSSRSPSEDEEFTAYIFKLTGLALGIMGISLPVFAGALMALAHDLDWSYRYERDFHKTEIERAEIVGFRAWLGDDVPPQPLRDEADNPTGMPIPAGGEQ